MNKFSGLALITLLVIQITAFAGDRNFTYTYQSSVMAKGMKEFEVWSTVRLGKNVAYFAAIDNRLEFEAGLSSKLQTAFYINFSNRTVDNGAGKTSTFDFKGISSEWKYQFTNPYTHSVGFALYSELGLNTDEAELEGKVILDKKIKNTILALNLSAENEWELGASESETELKLETNLGIAYELGKSVTLGIELHYPNVFSEGKLVHSALFAGPTVSFTGSNMYAAFTLMPQVKGFKGNDSGEKLNLTEFEKFETRLIFSFAL